MTTPLPAAPMDDSGSSIRVLIADDEAHLGTILEQYLTARGHSVTTVRNGRTALERLRNEAFDVALLDVVMPEVDGLEVLRLIREEPLPPEIIIVTGNGTIETAMAALKLGAYDFLSKPYRMAEIDALVRRAWEKRILIRDNRALHRRLDQVEPAPQFITQYAPLTAVLSLVRRIATSTSPVLIHGEQGTGKRLLARSIHVQGRVDGPFIEVDGRTLAGPSAKALLFGTDALADGSASRTLGALELATGGTLYISAVDAVHADAQARMARALADQQFVREGGAHPLTLRTRVVASTAEDLSRMVQEHEIREDLLHLVSAVRVHLPPLRERHTDITPLALHVLNGCNAVPTPVFTTDALILLERYRWPGNVSELRNVIERAVMLATEGSIGSQHLVAIAESADGSGARSAADGLMTLEAMERQRIADVLADTQWHQGKAAEILGISPKTLYRKIREFGFKRPSGRSASTR